VLLFKEFDLQIREKADYENVVADHLSRMVPEATRVEELPIDDSFLDDQLLAISHQTTSWYADLMNNKACGVLPPRIELSTKEEIPFRSKVLCLGGIFSTSFVVMGSKEDVCQKMRLKCPSPLPCLNSWWTL